ncbi:nuclear transport factor 2 family protein [Kiloniella majae]|uniref:nuclear transport factor 2 family protein n=1 Tax=Kiloniella majae TaxID=1938558 RepID=UPI000A2786A1|nr:nuclear transport factor 2 family protein [Kiloniella majae]
MLILNEEDSANIRTIKSLYLALKRKDREGLLSLLTKEPVWNVSPGFPGSGIYRGIVEVFGEFYPKLLANFESFGAHPDRFIDSENTVVVLGHYHIVGKHVPNKIEVRFSHCWDIDKDGCVKGVWQVADSGLIQRDVTTAL